MKRELREPWGKLYSSIHEITVPEGRKLVTVGDRVSYNSITAGLKPCLIVYDEREKRGPIDPEMKSVLDSYVDIRLIVSNPPGVLTKELQEAIKKSLAYKVNCAISVTGEDDSAAFQIFLDYPIGTIVLYGQPDRGIVFVEIDETIKNKCRELQSRMKQGLSSTGPVSTLCREAQHG